jgi:hypothetical protein
MLCAKRNDYLEHFINKLLEIAGVTQKPVKGKFNGIILEACPDSTPKEIEKFYAKEWTARKK